MLQRVPHLGAIVAASILLALLLWSTRPQDPLVVEQRDITRPFEGLTPFQHETPPSFRLTRGGQG